MDINQAFPKPSNPSPGSPEAILQAVLKVAAPNGGLWLKGRHVYHTRVMAGVTDQQAMLEAASAAANGDVNRVRQAMDRYYGFYPNQVNDTESSAFSVGGLRKVFGSRRH